MPFVKCLGCEKQKRSKVEYFYRVNNLPLAVINVIRKESLSTRELDALDEIAENSKMCRSCWKLSHQQRFVNFQNRPEEPDLTFWRKGINSHARTVGCWFLDYAQYHGIQLPNPNICNVSITIPKIKQKA